MFCNSFCLAVYQVGGKEVPEVVCQLFPVGGSLDSASAPLRPYISVINLDIYPHSILFWMVPSEVRDIRGGAFHLPDVSAASRD